MQHHLCITAGDQQQYARYTPSDSQYHVWRGAQAATYGAVAHPYDIYHMTCPVEFHRLFLADLGV